MKSFFQIVFGTLFALILFTVVVVVLCIATVVGLARLGSKQEPVIEQGSYLVVDLSANLADTPPSDNAQVFSKLFGGNDTTTISLRSVLDSINLAAKDSRIAGIFLSGSFEPQGYGSGFAAIKEMREALTAFHATSKKPIVAYLVAPSTRDYYLASAADTIYLNPYGEMELPGLATQPMFFKGALDKYGVGVQVTRVGKYKSAVEPYLTDKMSPESREQTQKLLDDVWAQFKEGVAQSRETTPEEIQALVDKDGIISPDDAKAAKLITDTKYLPDVIDALRKQTGAAGTGSKRTFKQVSLANYVKRQKSLKTEGSDSLMNNAGMSDGKAKVAIVYAEGEIVDGDSDAAGVVAGDRYARELRRLRQDPSVKAILLRVNSPGGSGLASETIQRELALAREAGKPVVVSMGTVAASGGYWISTASDRVFAEPNTITGSIGVFGLLPNIKGLANDHGVTFDEVKTGKFAALNTAARPKSPEELAVIQHFVDDFYGKFVRKVADARHKTPEEIQEIAQGRVWSGTDALKLGLVDEIGGLEHSLAYTKEKAGLGADAKVVEYPAPKELAEVLAQMFSGEKRPVADSRWAEALPFLGAKAGKGPLGRELGQVHDELGVLTRLNDPMGTYARLPFDLQLH